MRKKKMNLNLKIILVFVVVLLIFVGRRFTFAEKQSTDEQIVNFGKNFLEDTFQTVYHQEYQGISEKYLYPENDLFNEEVKIRLEIGCSIAEDFAKQNVELKSEGHFYEETKIIKGKTPNTYRFYTKLTENVSTGGNFIYTVTLDILEKEGKLYIINLYSPTDGLSYHLNKASNPEGNEILLEGEKSDLSIYANYLNSEYVEGITPVDDEGQSTLRKDKSEVFTYPTEEALKAAQLKNLSNLREKFTQAGKIDL